MPQALHVCPSEVLLQRLTIAMNYPQQHRSLFFSRRGAMIIACACTALLCSGDVISGLSIEDICA
jgi:hypothetical protein